MRDHRVMEAFHLTAMTSRLTGARYREFIRNPQLSVGVYHLSAGATDPQKPHNEDEVYYVVSGRGSFRSADAHVDVDAGSVIFVPAREPHQFENITEDLQILVFFAPAEGSQN